MILSVLGIDLVQTFYHNRLNLYHSGDKVPFGTLTMKDGHATLKVGDVESLSPATNISLGKYVRP